MNAFFDIRIFNPFAPTNKKSVISKIYHKHEDEKRTAYGDRIRNVEHGSFTPIVLSLTGGLAREATQFYKHLASLLSPKWDMHYFNVMGWIRCCLSFSLLRASIMCIRGSSSSCSDTVINSIYSPTDLVQAESKFS